jgi:hypothetical protein
MVEYYKEPEATQRRFGEVGSEQEISHIRMKRVGSSLQVGKRTPSGAEVRTFRLRKLSL